MVFVSSNHVHSLPLGFFRTGIKNRGRGLENATDRSYTCTAVHVSTALMRRAARQMTAMFPRSGKGLDVLSKKALLIEDVSWLNTKPLERPDRL